MVEDAQVSELRQLSPRVNRSPADYKILSTMSRKFQSNSVSLFDQVFNKQNGLSEFVQPDIDSSRPMMLLAPNERD
jgi:hypothetical protein